MFKVVSTSHNEAGEIVHAVVGESLTFQEAKELRNTSRKAFTIVPQRS